MKFYGKPYMGVFELNKNPRERTNPYKRKVLVFRFDQKGEFVTEDPKLIKRLVKKFKHEEENKLACKKCPFTCNNKGELMAHYRVEHPKEG